MTFRVTRWVWCSLLPCVAGLLGCAGLSPTPDKGGPTWFRFESEHFVLYSDLDAERARDTIHMFERLLDAYYRLGWEATGKLPVKLHVVAFEDRADFDVFGAGVDGYYVRVAPFEPLVVMPRARRIDDFVVLKHELTHHIAFQSLPFQPQWFAEGLAGYFQSAYFDTEDRFVIGAPPRDLLKVLRFLRRSPSAELMAAEPGEPDARFYATSWLLVHYLMSHREEAFVKYQDGLMEGLGHEAAWTRAFPDLTFDRLDQVLERYYVDGEYTYFARAIPPYVGSEPRASVLDAADVYALRAHLFRSCQSCGSEKQRLARENVAKALELEPHHLRASILRIAEEPSARKLSLATALTEAHPEAPLAWMLRASSELAQTQPPRCSAEATSRLRVLGRGEAQASMFAATCHAAAGETQVALELAKSAATRQPADGSMLSLYAALLLATGDCEELQRVTRRLRNAPHMQIDHAKLATFDACRPAAPTVGAGAGGAPASPAGPSP